MKLSKIDNQWWVTDLPEGYGLPELPGFGPYETRWDADDALEGFEKFLTMTPRQISVDSPLCRRGAVQLVAW